MDSYSRSEVAWLLGLSREEAEDLDAMPGSSWGGAPAVAGEGGLPVTVLRHEVQAAATRVARRAAGGERAAALTIAVLALRGRGWSLRAVAVELGVSHSMVDRRFRAGLDDVLEELGKPAAGPG